jgi:hypothetical protein
VFINKLDFLDEKEQLAGLKSLSHVTASREINGKKTSGVRLYISGVESDAKSFNTLCQVCRRLKMSKMRGKDKHPKKNGVVVFPFSGSYNDVTFAQYCDL